MKYVVKRKRPDSKCRMQYDKLIVDHQVYMYNDLTGQIEEVYSGVDLSGTHRSVSPVANGTMNNLVGPNAGDAGSTKNGRYLRTPSGGGRSSSQLSRIQKSFSTESSLNHMVPSSPVHPPQAGGGRPGSRDMSPTKRRQTSPRKSMRSPTPKADLLPEDFSPAPSPIPPLKEADYPEETVAAADEKVEAAPIEDTPPATDPVEEADNEAIEKLEQEAATEESPQQPINGHFSRKSNPDIPETIPE